MFTLPLRIKHDTYGFTEVAADHFELKINSQYVVLSLLEPEV